MAEGFDRDEVVEGFAEAVFVSEWASAWDRLVEDEEVEDTPWPGGAEISDYAPPTPDAAREIAQTALQEIESLSGQSIEELYDESYQSEYDVPANENEFGWQLGMVWLGHGIGAADAVHQAVQGYGEVMIEVDPETGDAEILYSSTWAPPTNQKKRKGPGFEFLN